MTLRDELFALNLVRSSAADNVSISYEQYQELKNDVYQGLTQSLGKNLYSREFGYRKLREEVFTVIRQIVQGSQYSLTDADRAVLTQEIVDDILGLGPIESLLRDPEVTEIMVNSPTEVYAERGGVLSRANVEFHDSEQVRHVIDRIVSAVGRRVDESSPMVDARLRDGSRVNAVVPPVAVDGPSFTIRKFSGQVADRDSLVRLGSLTPGAAEFLECAIVGKRNMLISGGTGSGKTTTLNVLAALIPETERIVTIEDSAELRLSQDHVIRLESRPSNIEGMGEISIRDLVRNSLRMRPDRIVVGEVRDAAALDMLQAMNTGHDGSLSTVHANSNPDALSRIETMASMSELRLPVSIIREQVASAIDILIHQERFRDGSRKITAISEVTGLVNGSIEIKDIFSYVFTKQDDGSLVGELVPTGYSPMCLKDLSQMGIEVNPELFGAKQ